MTRFYKPLRVPVDDVVRRSAAGGIVEVDDDDEPLMEVVEASEMPDEPSSVSIVTSMAVGVGRSASTSGGDDEAAPMLLRKSEPPVAAPAAAAEAPRPAPEAALQPPEAPEPDNEADVDVNTDAGAAPAAPAAQPAPDDSTAQLLEGAAEEGFVDAANDDDEVLEMDDLEELTDDRQTEPPAAAPAAEAPPAPKKAKPSNGKAGKGAKNGKHKPPMPPKRRRPWFEDFFSDDYLRTVRAPTPKEVARECDAIVRMMGVAPGATILDVGCGLGLHAIELTRRGFIVVGLDLSLPMLSRAADEAQDLGMKLNFLHADMREMTFDGAFDVVLSWGTSFGYFDDEGNRRVIERFHRALRPGGILLLDLVNRDHVIHTQPNLVWFEGDGCICMEETKFNYFSSRLEVKRNVILDDGRQHDRHYSLRLYSLHELGQMLNRRGFRVAEVSGRYATPGVFFGAQSPRLTVKAERRVSSRDTPSSGSLPPPPPGGRDDGKSEPPPPPGEAEVESKAKPTAKSKPKPKSEPPPPPAAATNPNSVPPPPPTPKSSGDGADADDGGDE